METTAAPTQPLQATSEAPSNQEGAAPQKDTIKSTPKKGSDVSTDGGSKDSSPKPESTPEEPKYKIKVNNVEREIPLSELLKKAQLAEGAMQKFELAARAKKEAEEKESRLEKQFKDTLRNMVKKQPEKWREIEEVLAERLHEEALDPRERKIKELTEQLQATEAEKEAKIRSQEEEKIVAYAEKFKNDLGTKLMTAIEGSGLPKDPETIALMAGYMQRAIDAGYTFEEIDMNDVVSYTRDKVMNQVRSLIAKMEGMDIIKLFGDDVSNKIRKADLARLKGGNIQSAAKDIDTKKVNHEPKQKKQYMNPDAFRDHLTSLLNK